MVYFLFTALNWRFGPGFQRFTGDSQVIQLSKGTRGGLKRHREKLGVELRCSIEGRETIFGSSYQVRKLQGWRNRASTVCWLFKRKIHQAARNLPHRCLFSCTLCVVIAKVIL